MSNSTMEPLVLRYGFDLDRGGFADIGLTAQLVMSLFNTLLVQPFPLFILFRRSRNMSGSIRRGYIAMHLAYITYDIIFFFLARIYVLLPWPGLYCEGPLCSIGLPRGAILGFISFSIVLIQPPFAFLIIRMHQMIVAPDSPLKLSKRVQIIMASVQITLMSLNVVGFVVFGTEPDNNDQLLEEPEMAYYAARGTMLLFGSPGQPQEMMSELIFFYITLLINFPVLCVFIVHSTLILRQTELTAKSTQTQRLSKNMYQVFFLQLTGVTICHVIPLTCLMLALRFNLSICFSDVVLAWCKLICFTLNSTQFCAIFVFKNPTNRKMLVEYIFATFRRFRTDAKIESITTPINKNNSVTSRSFSVNVI